VFELPAAARVDLAIYSVDGRLVRRLEESSLRSAGVHRVTWNGRSHQETRAVAGVYFCRLQAGEETATRRLLLLSE
jgi:hypothetical protein